MTQPAARCPDDNELAALAEGRLPAARRDALFGHVADCRACGAVVAAVHAALDAEPAAAAGSPVAPPLPSLEAARARRGPSPRVLAVAAATLVAVGVGLFAASRRGADAPPVAQQVASAFDALGAARADLFGGLTPLGADELSRGGESATRGGLVAFAPVGAVLETRPAFSWQPVPGVSGYTVVVRDGAGAVVWTKRAPGAFLPYPPDVAPLAPGAAYTWSVEATAALGRVEGRRAFSTADADAVARWKETLREVKARVPETLRALVGAQVALRRGYVVEAERLAAEQRAVADGPLARDVERHVRRRLGHEPPPSPPAR